MASPSKVAAACERYEALLVAAQQEFDEIQEQRLALSERLSAVKGRLEDIQLALDAFAVAQEERGQALLLRLSCRKQRRLQRA